jgi:hypothetical protein
MIDAHHHLWDLSAVHYPWLEATGVTRFFGDPTPIQRDYLVDEFSRDASAEGFTGSVHIQVGAADGLAEAKWVQHIAEQTPIGHWPRWFSAILHHLTYPPSWMRWRHSPPSVASGRSLAGRQARTRQPGRMIFCSHPPFLPD